MKKILALGMVIMLCLSGCGIKDIFITTPSKEEQPTLGMVLEECEIKSDNSEYYSKIAIIQQTSKESEMLNELYDDTSYGSVGIALRWKIKHSKIPNEKLHVVVEYCEDEIWYDNSQPEKFREEVGKLITEINNKSDINYNFENWVYFCPNAFYTIMTAEEILNLGTDDNFRIEYVGSNNANPENLDMDTTEGVDVYVELYGDGYVQCIEGKEVIDYTK